MESELIKGDEYQGMEKDPKGIPSNVQNKAGNRNMVEDATLVEEALEQKLEEMGTGTVKKGTIQRRKEA